MADMTAALDPGTEALYQRLGISPIHQRRRFHHPLGRDAHPPRDSGADGKSRPRDGQHRRPKPRRRPGGRPTCRSRGRFRMQRRCRWPAVASGGLHRRQRPGEDAATPEHRRPEERNCHPHPCTAFLTTKPTAPPGPRWWSSATTCMPTLGSLEGAINERTAAVAYLCSPFASNRVMPLDKVCEIAHAHDLPVIVDAASMLPPRENLYRYLRAGGRHGGLQRRQGRPWATGQRHPRGPRRPHRGRDDPGQPRPVPRAQHEGRQGGRSLA